ncbi:MAG: hypothetical protein MHPSP_000198, partial [Paramarteilia canceri]
SKNIILYGYPKNISDINTLQSLKFQPDILLELNYHRTREDIDFCSLWNNFFLGIQKTDKELNKNVLDSLSAKSNEILKYRNYDRQKIIQDAIEYSKQNDLLTYSVNSALNSTHSVVDRIKNLFEKRYFVFERNLKPIKYVNIEAAEHLISNGNYEPSAYGYSCPIN